MTFRFTTHPFLHSVFAMALALCWPGCAGSSVPSTSHQASAPDSSAFSPSSVLPGSLFLYSHGATAPLLEGEALGTAFGRALESTTRTMLPRLRADSGHLRVRLTNERPETHDVREFRLFGVDRDPGTRVLLDPDGAAWQVRDEVGAARASDHSRRDVRAQLAKEDGEYWESDLTTARAGGNWRDEVMVDFPLRGSDSVVALTVTALNTHLPNAVFAELFAFLGEDAPRFMMAAEHDSSVIASLRGWRAMGSLRVERWIDQRWDSVGTFLPEANVAPFTRVLRIPISGAPSYTLRLRLSSLPDVWRLDRLALDPDGGQARTPVELPVSLQTPRKPDRHGDPILLMPGEEILLSSPVTEGSSETTRTYFSEVRGYLYEWFPPENTPSRLSFPGTEDADRLALVTTFLAQPRMLLPLVYRHWKEVRSTYPRPTGLTR